MTTMNEEATMTKKIAEFVYCAVIMVASTLVFAYCILGGL